jgi:dihydrofolate reductase
MRSLTYYVGCSLDGVIAGPAGEIDHYPLSDDHLQHMVETLPEVLPTHIRQQMGIDDLSNRWFDTVVMGSGTYQPALDIGVSSPYAHLRTYVATTRSDLPPAGSVTLTGDPLSTVRDLKAEDGPLDVWLCGGGALAATLADEIDRLILKLYPVVAGDGIRIFEGGFSPRAFSLEGSETFDSGCTVLTYRRRPPAPQI